MPHQSHLSLWKNCFLSNKALDASNLHLDKIKKSSGHLTTFSKAFEEFSKNDGIAFLVMDPNEPVIQLLHHGHVLGGSWDSPTKKLVAILGLDSDAKPVQLVSKSIKNIKEKTFELEELQESIEEEDQFTTLNNPKVPFQFKNIVPIPNLLIKVFAQLESTSPYEVAQAFLAKMLETSILDTL
jgi:hypothetical protein